METFTPTSKLVFDSNVKKAWILLTSEDERVSFTKLILEAVKSDGEYAPEEKTWLDGVKKKLG